MMDGQLLLNKEGELVGVQENQRQLTREQLIAAMLEGRTFQQISAGSYTPVKRAMAYRLLRAVRTQGLSALQDRRQGHPSKLRGAVRAWLETSCRAAPHTPSSVVQTQLQERFNVNVSISQINRVRRQLGVGNHAGNGEPGKKQHQRKYFPLKECGRKGQEASCCWLLRNKRRPSRSWRPLSPQRSSPLLPHCVLLTFNRQPCVASCSPCSFWKLWEGLQRTWDLRAYSGQALALLTNRRLAYGYRHIERFLAELARVGADEVLTHVLAGWTASLWKRQLEPEDSPVPVYYIDGHRKAVYSDALIPRGLVGRLEKVLGCRALVVMHDQEGHPLLVTTHRGDQHLTMGLKALLTSYEQAAGLQRVERMVIDREGMAAEFLATLADQGRTVVTVLRTDQYTGLESFREVGEFVPLRVDHQGKVTREVALARFGLPLPEHRGPDLDVRVALIRDLVRQVPDEQRPEDEDGPRRWDEKPDGTHEHWLDANWQATPMPALPTVPKLIPIVTTAREADAVELAQIYTRRWPAQENAIRDWLIPLGIDVNHGFAKMPVINSEIAKKREALQRRLDNVRRWAEGARKRMHNASKLYMKRCQLTKERADTLYCVLNTHQRELEQQGIERWQVHQTIREEKVVADAEIEEYQQRQWKAYHTSNKEFAKCEKYCREQRELLRAIEDLAQQERDMYELDNRKDQIMTVCKVALANLGLWVRDHYFPAEYAHATWHRLQPFFQLPGRISWGQEQVEVELKRFNDRALNRDLEMLCAKVAQEQPRLPDGRRLLFRMQGAEILRLDTQAQAVA